jgi:hypothetical protein
VQEGGRRVPPEGEQGGEHGVRAGAGRQGGMVARVRIGRGEHRGERDRTGREQQRAGEAQARARALAAVGQDGAEGVREALGDG